MVRIMHKVKSNNAKNIVVSRGFSQIFLSEILFPKQFIKNLIQLSI